MENLVHKPPFRNCYEGKTVFVSGHTGFKGGWLTIWLKQLGACVVGLGLAPDSTPNLFESAEVAEGIVSRIGDIRDRKLLTEMFHSYQPEFVFHLAAQPLVRRSYDDPIPTFETNVMGTANLLETVRHTPSVKSVVVVTSDKCYENRDWVYAYRENDSLGGHDPYSASKAAAEIVTRSYRDSYFRPDRVGEPQAAIASARAGNVFGGGDWSVDRLIPDCVKALVEVTPIPLRNPHAIRPWQHVLEPLAGYLWLGVKLLEDPRRFAGAWNFGPSMSSHFTVRQIVELLITEWKGGSWVDLSSHHGTAPHEASVLKLDCAKAAELLDWAPIGQLQSHLQLTVDWYRRFYMESPQEARRVTVEQIEGFVERARGRAAWAG